MASVTLLNVNQWSASPDQVSTVVVDLVYVSSKHDTVKATKPWVKYNWTNSFSYLRFFRQKANSTRWVIGWHGCESASKGVRHSFNFFVGNSSHLMPQLFCSTSPGPQSCNVLIPILVHNASYVRQVIVCFVALLHSPPYNASHTEQPNTVSQCNRQTIAVTFDVHVPEAFHSLVC